MGDAELISADARGNLALGRQHAHGLFKRIDREDGQIILEPQVAVPASQAYFWSPRWQAGEARVEKDLKAGRVHEGTAADVNAKLEQARRRP